MNRSVIKYVALVVLLGLGAQTPICQAQPPRPENKPQLTHLEQRAEKFLKGISEGKTEDALDALVSNSPLLNNTTFIEQISQQARNLETRFGPYRGFEKALVRPVGKDTILAVYLYKCENYPVAYYFTFYRGGAVGDPSDEKSWRLVDLSLETKVANLLLVLPEQ